MRLAPIALGLAAGFPREQCVGPASAEIVRGGGSSVTDCVMVLDIPGANKPAPPKVPKSVDCIDGDPSCDDDGTRNGQCVFEVRACINSTMFPECQPDNVTASVVDHAVDDGTDPKFDNDFLALQVGARRVLVEPQRLAAVHG